MAMMVVVNNPGDWGNVYAPLLHAEWHGCTPTDLVFPFFLFIVGFAVTLSRKSASYSAIASRAAKIILLGWFLAGFPYFNLATLRIPGVLPRIGLCYLAAASLYRACDIAARGESQSTRDRLTSRVTLGAALALLLGYWAVLMLVPGAGGVAGDLTPSGNVGAVIDRALMLGHLWKPEWDPEGLLSTFPATGTTLIGVLAGVWFRNAGGLPRRAAGLAIGGSALALAGLAWSLLLPLNKGLWTSSYAVYTAGLGALLLAACVWCVDVRGWRRVSYPFTVLGTNAIALFVLSGLLAKLLGLIKVAAADGRAVSLKSIVYQHLFVPFATPVNASLLYAFANLAVLYGVLWVMYKRGVFLKV
jgi:predicted acyltransferase